MSISTPVHEILHCVLADDAGDDDTERVMYLKVSGEKHTVWISPGVHRLSIRRAKFVQEVCSPTSTRIRGEFCSEV